MDRLSYGIYQLLTAFARLLPIALCCRLGALLGWIGYLFLGRYRRLAVHNLRIAFPEARPGEIRRLANKHFRTLGANLLSSLKIARLSRDQIRALASVEGLATVEALVAGKRGIVMIISHIGNWELFAQLWPVIIQCPGGTVYQRLGNPLIDAAVRQNRARLGIELFERKEGFQGAMQLLRQGGCIGVLVDQHAGDAGVWCPFFGRLASTSSLAATLALRTGATLLDSAVYSDGVGRWKMVVGQPLVLSSQDPSEVTAQVNRTLEAQIRRQPADWFWVHNRWKTPAPKFLLATYKRGIAGTGAAQLQPFRILIRTSNWLGDAVMSVPAVQAIKRGRPDAHVTVLTPAKLADFWRSVPEVDEIVPIKSGQSVFSVARTISGRFEAAIIFPNSLRTALEAFLAGIPRRVGYPGHRRTALLNQVFRPKKKKGAIASQPRHQVHHYLALAQFVGAEIEGTVPVSDRASSRKPIEPPSTPAKSARTPVFGLCAGAEYGPAKRWLPTRFADVISAMEQRTGCQWKLFGVEKDRPVVDAILKATKVRCEDLVGKTSLADLIAHLRSCDLLLTNDTGTMHLAASLGIPVVALFGSTEPALTGPLGAGHQIVRRHVECSPCFLRECPIDFRCMEAITVAEVVAAIERVQAQSLQNPQPPQNGQFLPEGSSALA